MKNKNNTEKRKDEHIAFALKSNNQYSFSSEFDRVHLIHNALPEMDLKQVDLSTDFLGKKIDYPLLIVGMTGGTKLGKQINLALASIANKYNIPMGLGSQRAMLENPEVYDTYYIRDVAPSIPIIGNIGAIQIKKYETSAIAEMCEKINVDALAIHLNPLQEVVQPEGETDFSGVLDRIRELVKSLKIPIIVKETGAGISTDVANKLKGAGVKYIDISGSGGTSWSKIEYARSKSKASKNKITKTNSKYLDLDLDTVPGFENWGIPTLRSLFMTKHVMPIIASGGLRNGIDIIKSIVLGAKLGGAAYPFLKAFYNKNLDQTLGLWIKQMKIASFLTGSKTYADLKNVKYYIE